MPHLIAAVYVQDPATREELILLPGECPDPRIAALITNPDAWDVPPGAEDLVEEPAPVPAPDADQAADASTGGRGAAKKTTQRRARSAAE
jgi:hypothetical protein